MNYKNMFEILVNTLAFEYIEYDTNIDDHLYKEFCPCDIKEYKKRTLLEEAVENMKLESIEESQKFKIAINNTFIQTNIKTIRNRIDDMEDFIKTREENLERQLQEREIKKRKKHDTKTSAISVESIKYTIEEQQERVKKAKKQIEDLEKKLAENDQNK